MRFLDSGVAFFSKNKIRTQAATINSGELQGKNTITIKKPDGLDQKDTKAFGEQVLAARRFVEKGSRFGSM